MFDPIQIQRSISRNLRERQRFSVSDGAELYHLTLFPGVLTMPETLKRANQTAMFIEPAAGALELLGRSPAVMRVQELVRRAAALRGGLLITAERGVDVAGVVRELHHRGAHPAAAYIVVDCEGQGPAECERLLFGTAAHETADDAADLDRVSHDSGLAAARGGTLFLQSVTGLPAAVQTRLERVARDGEVRIEGERVAIDCRFVASATAEIDADVQARRFRTDLYRRLSCVRIGLPPLRDRAGDLPQLATRLLQDLTTARGVPNRTFTQAALALIEAFAWTGNVAELRHAIDRVLSSTSEDVIRIEHLLPVLELNHARAPLVPAGSLREARIRFEHDYIAAVLHHHHGRMADAARTLGIQRPNLYRKVRQLGIPLTRLGRVS